MGEHRPTPAQALLPPRERLRQLAPDLRAQGWTALTTGGQWRGVHRDGRATRWRATLGTVARDIRAGRVRHLTRRRRARRADQLRLFEG